MTRIGKGIKETLYKLDFFYQSSFLRYKDQGQYNTLTGGFVSLAIILLVTISFSEKVGQTFNKTNISSTITNSNEKVPTPFQIKGQNSKFMFGVQIWEVDLNDGPRYFDVVLRYSQKNRGIVNNSFNHQINLESCSEAHWNQFPHILEEAKELGYDSWLCLPLNASYEIKGKFLSKSFRNLQISIRKCSSYVNETRACATNASFASLQSPFTSSIYFINSNINPGNSQYLTYYLQSTNSITFTNTFGSNALLFIEDFQIQTDQSILPYPNKKQQSGFIVDNYAIHQFKENPSDQIQIASFQFRKSSSSRKYTRSFDKIDNTFSYLGGLVSTISLFLIAIKFYNSYNYEVSIGARIFKSQNKNAMSNWQKYHFLDFIGHLIYSWCETFGCSPNWTRFKSFYKVQEQMAAQLDTKFLIQRLLFFERALQILLDDYQLKGIHLFDKPTIEESYDLRKKYYIKNRLNKKIKKYLKQQNLNENKRTDALLISPQNSQNTMNMKQNIIFSNINSNNLRNIEDFKKIDLPSQMDEAYQSLSDISDEQNQNQNEEEELIELKKSVMDNNAFSKKIWQKLYPNMKEEINKLSLLSGRSHIKQKDINGGQKLLIEDLTQDYNKQRKASQQKKQKLQNYKTNQFGKQSYKKK